MEFEKKVIKTIKENNLINENQKVIVAVSGGPDSMALLNVLKNFRNTKQIVGLEIIVAHINHMLRIEAKDEELYVENYCENNDIKFFSKSVDVKLIAQESKKGIEETARKIRYEFFEEVLKEEKADLIAIAHNKNDNVETVFMNMFRGTGVNGLKGIEIKREKYIRPILEMSRSEIEEYCEENKINPKIDKSNLDNVYTRNKIRNVVIPLIQEEFNPNVIESITRLSSLVKEQEVYINKKVQEKFIEIKLEANLIDEELLSEENYTDNIILDLKSFNQEENVIKSKLVIYTITILFGNSEGIEKIHIEDIIKMCEKNEGNKFLTPNKNIKILVKNKKIYFIKKVQKM